MSAITDLQAQVIALTTAVHTLEAELARVDALGTTSAATDTTIAAQTAGLAALVTAINGAVATSQTNIP